MTPPADTSAESGLRSIIERYMAMYPAFRTKPEGAPNSIARNEQERQIALEDAARAALATHQPSVGGGNDTDAASGKAGV